MEEAKFFGAINSLFMQFEGFNSRILAADSLVVKPNFAYDPYKFIRGHNLINRLDHNSYGYNSNLGLMDNKRTFFQEQVAETGNFHYNPRLHNMKSYESKHHGTVHGTHHGGHHGGEFNHQQTGFNQSLLTQDIGQNNLYNVNGINSQSTILTSQLNSQPTMYSTDYNTQPIQFQPTQYGQTSYVTNQPITSGQQIGTSQSYGVNQGGSNNKLNTFPNTVVNGIPTNTVTLTTPSTLPIFNQQQIQSTITSEPIANISAPVLPAELKFQKVEIDDSYSEDSDDDFQSVNEEMRIMNLNKGSAKNFGNYNNMNTMLTNQSTNIPNDIQIEVNVKKSESSDSINLAKKYVQNSELNIAKNPLHGDNYSNQQYDNYSQFNRKRSSYNTLVPNEHGSNKGLMQQSGSYGLNPGNVNNIGNNGLNSKISQNPFVQRSSNQVISGINVNQMQPNIAQRQSSMNSYGNDVKYTNVATPHDGHIVSGAFVPARSQEL